MTIRRLIKLTVYMLATAISFAAAGADASALMRLDLKDGKVIAEIPQSLLGCRLMMATRIEQTSDSGEGAAGQLSDNCIPIVFSVEDKNLLITIPLANSLSGDSATPGIWKSYKVNSVNSIIVKPFPFVKTAEEEVSAQRGTQPAIADGSKTALP